MCFFFCFLAYFWLVSKELTEPRRCNWGRQLQVLEHVEVFQTVILLSIFFFGLECSFFRTANTMYFLCSQCAEQGDSLPEQANYLPLHPLWTVSSLITVRQRFCVLNQEQTKLPTLGAWASSQQEVSHPFGSCFPGD